MVTVACALLAIGYTVFYVAGSNLAHGPGKGVSFTEAVGLSTQAAPPSSASRATTAGPNTSVQPRATRGQTKPGQAPGSSSGSGS